MEPTTSAPPSPVGHGSESPSSDFLHLWKRSRPWQLLVIVGLSIAAAVGLTRFRFDDDYRAIFRSGNPDFALMEQAFSEFSADDNELLLVASAPDVLAPRSITGLRRLVEALRHRPDIANVSSILDAGLWPPGLPPRAFGAARAEAFRHPLAGHLVSADGTTTIVAADLGKRQLTVAGMEPILAAVRMLAHHAVADSALQVRLTGLPAMRVEVVRSLQRDEVRFSVIALLAAVAVAWVMFRSIGGLLIAAAGPLAGVLWTLGALGWAGEPMNALNNVIPQLVLAISFTDSVHLLFHVRRERWLGARPAEASISALRRLGGACALTSLTTAVGFGSLALSGVDIVRRFGLACAAGTALGFLAVVLVLPIAAASPLGRSLERRSPTSIGTDEWRAGRLLTPFLARPRAVSFLALLAVALLATAWFRLHPDYRYREYLPQGNEASQAVALCDRVFGGVTPVHALVEWPVPLALGSPDVLAVLAETEAVFLAEPSTHHPLSVLNLLRSLPVAAGMTLEARARWVGLAPPSVLQRWLRADLRHALVTAYVPDAGAAALAPAFARLARRMRLIEAAHPGFRVRLTGLAVVAAEGSLRMLSGLARSLSAAAVVIFVLMALAFRSLRLGVLSIIPNVLPLVGAAALLVSIDQPLRYTSASVFSICLGLAVDDTIHLVTAFRHASRETADRACAVRRALRATAAPVVTTTVLLLTGFGTLLFSELEPLRLFGYLSCWILILALVGDLVVLPALLIACGPGHSRPPQIPSSRDGASAA